MRLLVIKGGVRAGGGAQGKWALLLASLCLLAAIGPPARGGDAPLSSDPVFKALLVDGGTVSGRLESLGPGAIRLATSDGVSTPLALNRVVKLTRDVPFLVPADRLLVVLPEGDRITRAVVGVANETSLDVKSDSLGALAVPLESILGLILNAPAQTGLFETTWDRLLVEPRSSDVVWLMNGDAVTGGFLGLDDLKVDLQVDGKPVAVDRTSAVALGFDPVAVKYPRPTGDFMELTLKDGTRLGVLDAHLEGGAVLATARFRQPIRFPLGELVSIHARSGSLVYLSERQPAGSQYVTYIGPKRDYRLDRTVDGHLFQLAGQTFDRGLGAQSRTLIGYRILPGDRRFQALVGVDERAGPLGSVVFVVLVDGKERFRSPALTDRDDPKAVDVDLTGGKTLILATEFGERGDVRDLADWVEARIIR